MRKNAENDEVIFRLVYHVLVFIVEILIILLVAVGIIQCCEMSYQFCYEIFGSVSVEEGPGVDRDFEVKKSDSAYRIAERLQEKGLIKNRYSFFIRAFLTEKDQTVFHSGEYVLNTSMNYEDILNVLTMGE